MTDYLYFRVFKWQKMPNEPPTAPADLRFAEDLLIHDPRMIDGQRVVKEDRTISREERRLFVTVLFHRNILSWNGHWKIFNIECL